jgi:two-component system, chemotaxis family, CheB/CheR fusion protein
LLKLCSKPGISMSNHSLRVLVVDDCHDTTDSLAILLRIWGQECVVAHDGPSALREVAVQGPDVILLDIGLPGMDGWEVARRLRQMPNTEGALLVAMTGYGSAQDRIQSEEVGCDLHLLKPVDPGLLENLLAEAAQRKLSLIG